MQHNCDNCSKEIARKVFCGASCSHAYYNKVRHNVSVTTQKRHNASIDSNKEDIMRHNVSIEDIPEHTRKAHRTMNEEAQCKLCNVNK